MISCELDRCNAIQATRTRLHQGIIVGLMFLIPAGTLLPESPIRTGHSVGLSGNRTDRRAIGTPAIHATLSTAR